MLKFEPRTNCFSQTNLIVLRFSALLDPLATANVLRGFSGPELSPAEFLSASNSAWTGENPYMVAMGRRSRFGGCSECVAARG